MFKEGAIQKKTCCHGCIYLFQLFLGGKGGEGPVMSIEFHTWNSPQKETHMEAEQNYPTIHSGSSPLGDLPERPLPVDQLNGRGTADRKIKAPVKICLRCYGRYCQHLPRGSD